MGDRMLHRGAFAQRGASAFGFDLGAQLVLELFVLTDMQASPLPEPGFGALRSLWTPSTGAGGELGVFAWDQRHGLASRTGDHPVRKVQGEVVLREECPALGPGAGDDGDTLRGPLRNAWAGHVPQVDVELQQALPTLQFLSHQLHGLIFRLVGWADHHRARHFAVPIQDKVLLEPVERFGAALTAMPHGRVFKGDAAVRGHILLDTLAPRPSLRVWFGI